MSAGELFITTGDRDGIGLEVTLKALRTLSIRNYRVSVFLSAKDVSHATEQLGSRPIVLLPREDSPAHWVEIAAKHCLLNKSALVTGPLSKTLIRSSGLRDMGHTGILKRIAKRKHLHMGFYGEHFSVVLATDHIPLSRVPRSLTRKDLRLAIKSAGQLACLLPESKRGLPIAVLGLNPHAGESGLIGKEEQAVLKPLFRSIRGIKIVGPLVPDAAFRKENFSKYSVFVALYHDQGLIPFKLVHGERGAHVTLGLPFVRTSVDHGTAKDIFGKGVADPTSMEQAIKLAVEMMARRK